MIRVRSRVARQKSMPMRVWVKQIHGMAGSSVLVEWTLAVGQSDRCHRCSRPLTDPVSQMLHYGPECCKDLGISRLAVDKETAEASLREASSRFGSRRTWLEFSSIAEGIELLMLKEIPPRNGSQAVPASGVVQLAIDFGTPPVKTYSEGAWSRWVAKIWSQGRPWLFEVMQRAERGLGRALFANERKIISSAYQHERKRA